MAVVFMGRESRAGVRRGGGRGGGVSEHAGPLLHRGPDRDAAAQRAHGHRAARAARAAHPGRRRGRRRRCRLADAR